jgi:3-hydroxyisobutyrate dehydrogenase
MARSLLRAGRRVVVNDVCQTAMRKLEEEGATASASPSALAAAVGAGTLITMLPSCAAVRQVYTEALAAPGFAAELCIDCSTVEPGTATTVAGWAAAQADAAFVDAPVSGGVGGAEQATLTFMVGAAEEATVRRAEPLLLQMGRSVVHCGEVGSGQAVKLCNNLVLATTMLAVSEGWG